jgi:hypothetical protein
LNFIILKYDKFEKTQKIIFFTFSCIYFIFYGQCTLSKLDSGNISYHGINYGYVQVGWSGGVGVYHYSLQIFNRIEVKNIYNQDYSYQGDLKLIR